MENQAENQTFSIRVSGDELFRRILILLFTHPELPVDEVSKEVGVEISDIIPAIKFLVNKGFVHLLRSEEADEKARISLNTDGYCVIGLDLGGTKLYGAVSDLAGNILSEKEIKHHGKTGEECCQILEVMIETLIEASRQSNRRLLGIGVDVPGRVQLETGLVVNAPAVYMKDFPLKERLVKQFGYPVFVDNDLKQASLGEAWFGLGKNHRDIVLLSIGTGIAASVVVDGRPLRGAHLRFGEVGWMVPGREFLGRIYSGFGALETEASGPGIERRAKEYIRGTVDEGSIGEISSETVFEAARSGKEWAEKCVAETAEYLAVLIANIMAFYDPDMIILSGGVSHSSEKLLSPIQKLVEGCVLTPPTIVVSSLGYRAGALGAIINLIQNCPEVTR